MTAELEALASGYGLVEGPTVLPDGNLAFSDVLGGGVYAIDPTVTGGEAITLVPKRRGVGGIAVHAAGGVVCSGRDLIRVDRGVTTPIFSAEGAAWNDLAVGPDGAVWAGSVRFSVFDPDAEHVPGEVWRVTADGGEPVIDDVHHCNGIGFSPAGDRLYVSDTRRQVVVSAALDGTDRREFALPTPDGMAVDTDGFLWIATYIENALVRVDPEGVVERRIEIGQPVTSVCLTPDGTLFVVTGSDRDTTGSVLRTSVDAAGLALPAAEV